MKILITAYTPFGEDKFNSANEVVKGLDLKGFDAEIEVCELPVVYNPRIYEQILLDHKPDILLLCGQAAGRNKITLEYHGLNLMYAKSPDNEGVVKLGEQIFNDGDNSLKATIPTIALVEHVNDEHLALSLSAGGYICNMGLYSSLYYASKHQLNTRIGFIHFPLYNGQREDVIACLDLQLMINIFTKMITTLINDELK